MYEGVKKLLHPHPIEYAIVKYIVLTVAICVELLHLLIQLHSIPPSLNISNYILFSLNNLFSHSIINLIITLNNNLIIDQL